MGKLLAQVGEFFEAHVEKIVLGLVGLLGLYLLLTQVILGPNRVRYGNRYYSPGSIDDQIRRQAEDVAAGLDRDPSPPADYRSPLRGPLDANNPVRAGISGPLKGGFLELFGSALGHMGVDGASPLPMYATGGPTVSAAKDRTYRLPEVGDIDDVKVDHIRAAAYIPMTPITETNPYQDSGCDINDQDLVTVEAKFDLAGLAERFRESFTGDDVPAAWRDVSLAEPVFAAVQLQRRQSLDDGRWGDWQEVPRCLVEARRDLLRIPDANQDSGGAGVQVRKILFSKRDVMCDLLQPPTYQIASAYDDWLPPTLHREFLDLLAKQKKEEQRQAREGDRAAQDTARPDRRRAMDNMAGGDTMSTSGRRDSMMGRGAMDQRTGRANPRSGRLDQRNDPMAGPGRRGSTRPGTGRPGDLTQDPEMMGMVPGMENQMALSQVYLRFEQLRLTPFTDLTKLKELVFWAHDDTVEPGNTYQYRVRLGVLNPLAVTDQVGSAGQDRKHQAILWSRFSEVTAPLEIPARQYFFAKDFQENSGVVSIEVCKFFLGYWRSQDFTVRPGEVIGRQIESKPKDSRNAQLLDPMMAQYGPAPSAEQIFEPAEIDYGTGAILVAVSRVDGWTGDNRLRAQAYYDMLYSFDGSDIQRAPIGTSNWSTGQSGTFSLVKKLQRTPIEPPRAWNQSRGMGMMGSEYGYGYGEGRVGPPMQRQGRPPE